MNTIKQYTEDAISLLKQIIEIPSYSNSEDKVATLLMNLFAQNKINVQRVKNNILAFNDKFSKEKPNILLNSHIDTVKENKGYTRNPFKADIINNKLYGLGSNDAGASLVSLLYSFLYLNKLDLNFNLIFVASAEEEISGINGFELIKPLLPNIHLGIVGEPTLMKIAIAEKGLMVIDGIAKGKSGHAARKEGINPIEIVIKDLNKIKQLDNLKESDLLGEVKITNTIINAGNQHNVIPEICNFVLDVRSNEHYNNKELFNFLDSITYSKLKARSYRMNASAISQEHYFLKVAKSLGYQFYSSPTTSDMALMTEFDTIKLGPGDSARSHSADEFIYLNEIEEGIHKYIALLKKYNTIINK